MHYYEVAPNKIIRTDSESFTYSSELLLSVGEIVKIEIGKRQLVGIVISKTTKPSYQTKPIISTILKKPLPYQLISLALWISEYYTTPLAIVLQTILPKGIEKKRRTQSNQLDIVKRDRTNIVFNKQQLLVINNIKNSMPGTFLLQGVTGSGKTQVYIEIAKQSIKDKKSVIVLVPEIALTSQLVSEFSQHFTNLLVTHSKMTESARHLVWSEAINSSEPLIIIGPRSALFTPLKDIGAIIIDEAHEPSFKQDQSPRYSALRVATMLGRSHKAKVIFGSATPNITDRYLAEQSNRPILKLDNIARKDSIPPLIELIDMRKRNNFSKHRFLSDQLLKQIEETLIDKKQILIFHNRRGSTYSTVCKECGWTAECPSCHLPMSLHADKHSLLCHICGYSTAVPTYCPKCNSTDILHKGIGTKLIESELNKLFPNANIARFDADNSDNMSINAQYKNLYDGTIDIAIGTQIVAKGLDLPNLRTVGVIQADSGISLPDFSASERAFQLLAQVVGRVGRNHHKTQVIVQSYQPDHTSIINGLNQNYESFYKQTITERKFNVFPPFTYLLKLTCVYKTEVAAIKNSKKVANDLRNKINKNVVLLGPTPAFYERQHDTFRWQLILKSPKREYLINAIKLVPKNHWQSELDPTSLI
ncbi:MAG: hypothetical protein PWQ10_70 [Patescibacteria group bacterium]|nr:hypothetical protein [Patescibacteria group bacterium]